MQRGYDCVMHKCATKYYIDVNFSTFVWPSVLLTEYRIYSCDGVIYAGVQQTRYIDVNTFVCHLYYLLNVLTVDV